MQACASTGTPGLVKVVEYEDDHSLTFVTNNDDLLKLIQEVCELKDRVNEFQEKKTSSKNNIDFKSQHHVMKQKLFAELRLMKK